MKKILAMVVAFGICMPLVMAQDKGKTPEERFKAADKNSDGSLDKEEFKASLPEDKRDKADTRFAAIDKNSDGKLSLEEYKEGTMKKKKD
jgi:Ca2+-binding EF-hand superfamily protein